MRSSDGSRTTLLRSPGGREYGFGYDAGGIRDEVTMPGGAKHQLAFDATATGR